jgi:regulatory protein
MWRKRSEPDQDRKRVIKNAEESRERTMNRAVKLLAAKPRSVEELRERLLEKNWTDEAIVDRVIEKLKEYGYLDDEKYAGDLALSKLRQKPQGKRRLKQTLSQKKLSMENVDAAIDRAFEKMPETDLIDAAIEKRLRIKGIPKTRDDSKKFYDHLLRNGFGFDLIRSKMSAIRMTSDVEDTVTDPD